jgi:S-formylglutathione hydrolase FrmB
MHHPDLFHAAVSIAGYDWPAHDRTTGNLFSGHPTLADQNSPLWRAEHLPTSDLSLLLINSRQDGRGGTLAQAAALAAAARPPLRVWMLTVPRGGHNFRVWASELPSALGWLSRQVATPLTAQPAVDGATPRLIPAQPGQRQVSTDRPALSAARRIQ